jgi:hypothetical protein
MPSPSGNVSGAWIWLLCYEDVWGSGGIALRILNLVTDSKYVRLHIQPFYPLRKRPKKDEADPLPIHDYEVPRIPSSEVDG